MGLWEPVLAAVLQGSILGPLFFLNIHHHLPETLSSITKHFAEIHLSFQLSKMSNGQLAN